MTMIEPATGHGPPPDPMPTPGFVADQIADLLHVLRRALGLHNLTRVAAYPTLAAGRAEFVITADDRDVLRLRPDAAYRLLRTGEYALVSEFDLGHQRVTLLGPACETKPEAPEED